MYNPAYFLVLVAIMLLVFQLTLKLKVFFNVKKNIGKLQIKFLEFTVINLDISFESNYLKLTNKHGKSTYMPLKFDKQAIVEYTNFQDLIFRKIYFKQVSIYFNFGIKDNSFLSSMICGYVDVISKIAYSILKTKKSEVELESKIYPDFNTNVIKLGIKAKISLSIFDLIWSFIESKLSNKIIKIDVKELENARQHKNRKVNATSNE